MPTWDHTRLDHYREQARLMLAADGVDVVEATRAATFTAWGENRRKLAAAVTALGGLTVPAAGLPLDTEPIRALGGLVAADDELHDRHAAYAETVNLATKAASGG